MTNSAFLKNNVIPVTAIILIGLATGVRFYQFNMANHLNNISQESDRMLALTSSYVSLYSDLRADSQSHFSPVPAEFRARVAEDFNDTYQGESLFTARMVGVPEKFISTPPTDEHMSLALKRMMTEKNTNVFSATLDENGQSYVRTMYPSLATKQSCVDCHNKIQNPDIPWAVGDLMGAYVVENGIQAFKEKYQIYGIILGFLVCLTVLSIFVAFYFYRDLKQRALQLEFLASTDPLTGCFNRREFDDQISKLSSQVAANSALLLLDIDHFKTINDNHGHNAGDLILINFVQTVKKQLRRNDVFARVGGEEFYVYLLDTSEDEAKAIAARIKQSVASEQHEFTNVTFSITVSIGGLHTSHAPHQPLSMYSRIADNYLYKAKTGGRDRIEWATAHG